MEIVVDASAVLAVVLDEDERDVILEATENVTLLSPAVVRFEIGNALIAMYRRDRIEEKTVREAWNSAEEVPIQLVPVNVEESLEIALEHGIYAYDAYYLNSAAAYRRPLLTLDRNMRRISENLGIDLVI